MFAVLVYQSFPCLVHRIQTLLSTHNFHSALGQYHILLQSAPSLNVTLDIITVPLTIEVVKYLFLNSIHLSIVSF